MHQHNGKASIACHVPVAQTTRETDPSETRKSYHDESGIQTLMERMIDSGSKACWSSGGTSRPCSSKAKRHGKERGGEEKGGTLIVVATALYNVGYVAEEETTRLLRSTDHQAREGNGVTSDPTWK